MGRRKKNSKRKRSKKSYISNKYKNVNVKRNQKDTVFRMLYKTKKELLPLFNAVNSTNYESEDELEIVTLENAVYMSMKNDVSCLLDMNLQIYEHQSTINPNMPLRNLMYITKQLEKLIVKKDLYGRKLIMLPNPRFIVFYNGTDEQPETETLYLSSAYEHKEKEVNLELKVLQLNINKGYNEDVKSKCPSLFQYMQYVDILRENRKTHPLKDAVIITVDYCIEHDILKDFLLANKSEVISMSIFEYDEELHNKTLLSEGYDDGYADGHKEGHKEGHDSGSEEKAIEDIIKLSKNMNLDIDRSMEVLEIPQDKRKKYKDIILDRNTPA